MPTIVSRAEWGARTPKGRDRIAMPSPRLWCHHTGTEQHGAQGVRDIQRYHQDSKDWLDIAYSFLIDDDGTIYEGRGAGLAGAHTEGDNDESHAICLMGNFDNRLPTQRALDSLIWLARHGAHEDWWHPTLGGHRDAPGAQTACPGRHLYALLGDIRQAVAGGPTEEDDMGLTAEERDWLDRELLVIRTKVETTYNQVNRQAGVIYNALKAQGVDVDEDALAAALLPGLAAALSEGTVSTADLVAELRAVPGAVLAELAAALAVDPQG